MNWYPYFDDDFRRPATSPGIAGSTTGVGNGWVDRPGGLYHLDGTGLRVDGPNLSTSGAATASLVRPATEGRSAQKQVVTFPRGWSPGAAPGVNLLGIEPRLQPNGDHYLAHFTATTINLYSVVGGVMTALGGSGPAINCAGATQLQLTAEADAPAAGSTKVVVTVSDAVTLTVFGSLTVSDSTASLQGPGTVGLCAWTKAGTPTGVQVIRAQFFQGDVAGPSRPHRHLPQRTTGRSRVFGGR